LGDRGCGNPGAEDVGSKYLRKQGRRAGKQDSH